MEQIALVGEAYSGKSTIARELESKGYSLINFTDLLKRLGVLALQVVYPEMELYDILRNKAHYRPFLQAFGTVIGYDEKPHFVMKALEAWLLGDRGNAVFDCVRTPAQFDALKPFGFSLVYVQVSERVRSMRASRLGVTSTEFAQAMRNPLEDVSWAGRQADLVLDGTQPIEEIVQKLIGLNLKATV